MLWAAGPRRLATGRSVLHPRRCRQRAGGIGTPDQAPGCSNLLLLTRFKARLRRAFAFVPRSRARQSTLCPQPTRSVARSVGDAPCIPRTGGAVGKGWAAGPQDAGSQNRGRVLRLRPSALVSPLMLRAAHLPEPMPHPVPRPCKRPGCLVSRRVLASSRRPFMAASPARWTRKRLGSEKPAAGGKSSMLD